MVISDRRRFDFEPAYATAHDLPSQQSQFKYWSGLKAWKQWWPDGRVITNHKYELRVCSDLYGTPDTRSENPWRSRELLLGTAGLARPVALKLVDIAPWRAILRDGPKIRRGGRGATMWQRSVSYIQITAWFLVKLNIKSTDVPRKESPVVLKIWVDLVRTAYDDRLTSCRIYCDKNPSRGRLRLWVFCTF